MPNMSGVEVIQEIRHSYTDLKVAVISASTDKDVIQSLIQLKIDTFVKKPYNRAQVIQKYLMHWEEEMIFIRRILLHRLILIWRILLFLLYQPLLLK